MNIPGSIIIPHVTDLYITSIPGLFTTPQLNWIPHAKLSGRGYNNLIQNSWILETHDMNHVNRYHLIILLNVKCLPRLDKWSKVIRRYLQWRYLVGGILNNTNNYIPKYLWLFVPAFDTWFAVAHMSSYNKQGRIQSQNVKEEKSNFVLFTAPCENIADKLNPVYVSNNNATLVWSAGASDDDRFKWGTWS